MATIRIAFAGGGSGGHLYPLLSIADELKKKLPGEASILSYFGPKHGLADEFAAREIREHRIASSKFRRYFDIANLIDIPKFFWSLGQALIKLYFAMPDVVFSKGGPGALAVVLAARWYRIPVVIHESDAVPGLTNRLSAPFAKKILTAFAEAGAAFSPKPAETVGNPVRTIFFGQSAASSALKTQFQFDPAKPLITVLGGSQGSQRINAFILENLEALLPETQIYLQTGNANFGEMQQLANSAMRALGPSYANHFRMAPYLSGQEMKDALAAADIVLSRAGSGAIFEIAAAGRPSILVPLRESAGDHQRLNAYAYANTGAASVVEEPNLTPNLLLSEIRTAMKEGRGAAMGTAASAFARPNAAKDIARFIVESV